MITIQLQRNRPTGKAVTGTLILPFEEGQRSAKTLENADFIIPAGTYPLDLTWSPKFKKLMPEVQDVPERTGIRIHMGTKPEHSTGCVLMSAFGLNSVNSYINNIQKYYDNEEISIRVIDAL